jgi:hypothetical protein
MTITSEQLDELEQLRDEASRLADYDLTIPGGRAATRLLAIAARERELRAATKSRRKDRQDEH